MKQCQFAVLIYLTTSLSAKHGILLDRYIGAPGSGNDIMGGINTNDRKYFRQNRPLQNR